MRRPKLDAATWAQLNQLLDSALDQPASAWDRWVDLLGPEHAALKPRLRELLGRAADRDDPSFLETLPKFYADLADFPDVAIDGDRPGDAVGPYRLVRELGSGGMGVVWLAERSDGLVNRPVALKLPHQAWQRPDLSERMAREREILATLTHPNIARLYDAGLTEAHRPFLAIEYVEGRPIDEYLSRSPARYTGAREAVCAGRQCRRLRTREARGAPGSEAGQYPGHRRRTDPTARLRHREAAGSPAGESDGSHRVHRPAADTRLRVPRADPW